ncbi:MAG: hypothetical protein HUJ31_08210 [Pseudomonadales bacterium]|nr:hypothetical protein [Pseudomonadales bacterium]
MLPEMMSVRAQLEGEMDFDLWMAGLQIGSKRPIATWEERYLKRVWNEVTETTGQRFCGHLPDDENFIYHSEIPCRAVEALRDFIDAPPWDFFHRLQEAFYLEARNLNNIAELADLASPWGISAVELNDALGSERIIAATRANFDRASELSANALPTVLIDTGNGPELVCGGYATADYLVEELRLRAASTV